MTSLRKELSESRACHFLRVVYQTVNYCHYLHLSFVLILDGLQLFREFLRTEFSNENIEFWISCEEYKNSKEVNYPEHAQSIYSDFIAVQAPREVCLGADTWALILYLNAPCWYNWCSDFACF